jgi:hypothetical protein
MTFNAAYLRGLVPAGRDKVEEEALSHVEAWATVCAQSGQLSGSVPAN